MSNKSDIEKLKDRITELAGVDVGEVGVDDVIGFIEDYEKEQEEKAKLERELICIINRAVGEFKNPIEVRTARLVYRGAINHIAKLHGLNFDGGLVGEVAEFVKENKGLWT